MYTFKTYADIPFVLEKIDTENERIYTEIYSYLSCFSGNFGKLCLRLNELANDPIIHPELSPNKKPQQEGEEFHSQLYKAFPRIAENDLLQIPALTNAAEKLRSFADRHVDGKFRKYQHKNHDLIAKYKSELATIDKFRADYEAVYDKYMKAGIDLQNADTSKPEKVKELQHQFIEAKNSAMAAHKKCREETDLATSSMESLMTEFEEIELFRTKRIQRLFTKLADVITEVSQVLVQGSSHMSSDVSEIPFDNDSTAIRDLSKVRPAQTDDAFQVAPAPPSITKYMDPATIFAEEREKGGQLFQVTEDYDGPAGHIKAISGEYVIGLEQNGNFMLCKNINESEGLLPKSILAFPH